MDFDEIQQRLAAAKNVRIQRYAAERLIPGERLRRGLREAFSRQRADELRENREVSEPNPIQPTDAKR